MIISFENKNPIATNIKVGMNFRDLDRGLFFFIPDLKKSIKKIVKNMRINGQIIRERYFIRSKFMKKDVMNVKELKQGIFKVEFVK